MQEEKNLPKKKNNIAIKSREGYSNESLSDNDKDMILLIKIFKKLIRKNQTNLVIREGKTKNKPKKM